MWRFYLIAAVVVAVIGSIVVAQRLAMNGVRVHGDVRGTPRPAAGNANAGFVVTPPPFFDGEGGWVLSALPDCFDQLSSAQGPARLMRGRVPPDRERVAPGTTLHAGNCAVMVRAHDVWVFRGRDRLRVPPEARFYDTPSGLALVYGHGGRIEKRVYRAAATPAGAAGGG